MAKVGGTMTGPATPGRPSRTPSHAAPSAKAQKARKPRTPHPQQAPKNRRREAPAPGLRRAGARLPIDEYTRRLWERRHFISAYASATNSVGYSGSFLGQFWQVLNPLLQIVIYYFIFGLLLHTNRGVPDFIGFLSVGVFVFSLCTTSLTGGARSIMINSGLVRALEFPRAVLPLSTTLVAVLQLRYSLIVLVPILLFRGEPITWHWLLLIPALALQIMFCQGLAFVMARVGSQVPDTVQVLPFATRIWTYTSGVMWSVQRFTQGRPGWVFHVISLNPGYVFVTLARSALLAGNSASLTTWLVGAAWAVGLLSTSYLYFWRGEEDYGNV
ncbi:ABC transporter permease [Jatrophihabitans endophyticus]|uniref:ABC transporter permease n=1 Tax=Jatrophihabitans endophyticus TaxID=1206085 RepID=UPI001A04CCD3|nr:ABC transporter permease [Jatrophihabitans endophyticus]MBE7188093.1 ABC transporter permease [Jatrophihabitans endophyticus]